MPDTGELVVATIERITHYGAYVSLDEYNREGLLHISEISSTWVRNIRDYVRESQKVVLKVLRVDAEKGHIDLSLRRVSKRERREKLLSWKKDRKAESLLRSAAEKLEVPIDQIYEKAGTAIEKEYGLYKGLEKTASEGEGVLLKLGIPKNIATTLAEIAKDKIKTPMVKIRGMLELQCTKPDGARLIREALLSTQKIHPQGASINVSVIAPPRYRIEVFAENYKAAEKTLKRAVETAIGNITKSGGRGAFERET